MYRIGQEEIDEITKVIFSGQMFRVGDPDAGFLAECDKFENEWAEYTRSKHALLMSGGGTAALICSLAALGIGPGDEVIVPAYTWLATASSVLAVGAIPILAEINETLGLDSADFESKITASTKAVIPVHMGGRPADLESIIQIARKHRLYVVEDACQNSGGNYHGRKAGSWGDAGAFSFNHFKTISCGEGGALITNDDRIYERATIYHDSGTCFRPKATELSSQIFVAQQYRANEIMGAILRVQLRRLEGILDDLRRIRQQIAKGLSYTGFCVAPSNDLDGECGNVLALQFSDSKTARKFSDNLRAGYLGIDHGKHVYIEWTPIQEKLVNHHPDMNPFNFPQNKNIKSDYSENACPKTLEILKRTYFIPLNPDWQENEVYQLIENINKIGDVL